LSLEHKEIIGNVQLLHECKDTRDDHYAAKYGRAVEISEIGNQKFQNNRIDSGAEDQTLPQEETDLQELEFEVLVADKIEEI
jgi:hypothetical protein